MALVRVQDRKLFTAPELALLRSSLPSRIKALTSARLRVLIDRTRRVADKYRDLARWQLRARKRRTGMGGVHEPSNVRTQRKVQLLAAATGRFEKRLRQLERGERRRSDRPAKLPSPVRPARAAQGETFRREQQRRQAAGEAAGALRLTRAFQQSRLRTIQAHLRASGKRRQGKRDARR